MNISDKITEIKENLGDYEKEALDFLHDYNGNDYIYDVVSECAQQLVPYYFEEQLKYLEEKIDDPFSLMERVIHEGLLSTEGYSFQKHLTWAITLHKENELTEGLTADTYTVYIL